MQKMYDFYHKRQTYVQLTVHNLTVTVVAVGRLFSLNLCLCMKTFSDGKCMSVLVPITDAGIHFYLSAIQLVFETMFPGIWNNHLLQEEV